MLQLKIYVNSNLFFKDSLPEYQQLTNHAEVDDYAHDCYQKYDHPCLIFLNQFLVVQLKIHANSNMFFKDSLPEYRQLTNHADGDDYAHDCYHD